MKNTDDLNPVWWLWVPVAVMFCQIGLELSFSNETLAVMHSEGGPHETLQAIVIAGAFVMAARLLACMKKDNRWLVAWAGLAALCCFYVAGEEISWGQHILNWSTPEYWSGINDQNETNLHNTSSWLDQKPRLILLIGIITGGLLIPFLQKFKRAWVPEKFSVIYPPAILGVTAFFVIGVKLTALITKIVTGAPFFERASEVEELYMFYFVLLYMIVLSRRVLQRQR